MLRSALRCLCQRPPQSTTSTSAWTAASTRAAHRPHRPHTQSHSRPRGGPRGANRAVTSSRPPMEAEPSRTGTAHLASRLRALEEVDDNTPFDLQRALRPPTAVTASSSGSSARMTHHTLYELPSSESQLQRRTVRASHHARRPSVATMTMPTETSADTATPLDELAVFAEDDVVMNAPMSLRHLSAAASTRRRAATEDMAREAVLKDLTSHTARHRTEAESATAASEKDVAWHPSARGIGQDVIDLVTDAFREQREVEVAKRRRVLYELTHPNPVDYSYNGKLVPPPPLNFGRVTDEAVRLGNALLADQPYSLVRKAGTRVNAEAEEIALSDANTTSMLEGTGGDALGETRHTRKRAGLATVQPHRGRKREDNVFRDHNFFFELNELYQEIVLVGKACAGKSSLLNALLDQDVAKTSSTPNTTRQISFYQAVTPEEMRAFQQRERHNNLVKLPGGGRQLTFVDMPGFGIEGMSDKWRDAAIELTDAYFGVRRSVNTVLFCIDCERGLTAGDVKYFEWLENVQGVFYIVLTKCDSVSHTRLTSVMRHIYELITKKRRKFRKVFPFIIPTSAKTGVNIDTLRGLITETSGILPGDKLRDLLQHKKDTSTQAALAKEAQRLLAAREEARAGATRYFAQERLGASTTNPSNGTTHPSTSTDTDHTRAAAAAAAVTEKVIKDAEGENEDDDVFVPLDTPASATDANLSLFIGRPKNAASNPSLRQNEDSEGDDAVVDEGERARRRRRAQFLQWRQDNPLEYEETPYGKVRFRLNTGLDNPLSELLNFESDAPADGTAAAPDDGSAETTGASGPSAAGSPLMGGSSAVIGLDGDAAPTGASLPASPSSPSTADPTVGQVSRFLNAMDEYGSQSHTLHGRRGTRAKEKRWRRRYAPHFLAEDGEGRLSEFTAGKKSGPSLVDARTRVDRRKSEWKAHQLKSLLQSESPDAPWSSLPRLTQKINTLKEEAGMTGPRMRKKDVAAYLQNAGRITESFEKFEGEVTAAKYMNEVRQSKTLRGQQQMHLNATAKINYRSMPPGLWKAYGKKDTAWPTPRVLGRDQDESHRGK